MGRGTGNEAKLAAWGGGLADALEERSWPRRGRGGSPAEQAPRHSALRGRLRHRRTGTRSPRLWDRSEGGDAGDVLRPARPGAAQAPHPVPRLTAACTPRSCSASRASPAGSLLYHATRRPGPTGSRRSAHRARGGRDATHRHHLVKTARPAAGRRDVRTRATVLQRRRDVRCRPAGRTDAGRYYRNGEADEMLFVHEGTGRSRRLRPHRLPPGRLPGHPDRHHLSGLPGDGPAADAVARVPDRDRAAAALPERVRPAAGAPPYCERDIRLPDEMLPRPSPATSWSTSRPAAGSPPTTTTTTRSTWSAGMATCGRSPSTSRTSSRSPGGSTSRRPSTRPSRPATSWSAPSCRASSIPPAGHPRAVQPQQHQQRRGHLLRGRQLHEPSRRGHRRFTVHPAGHPARPASGHGRGVDRQGGDRGAGGDDRHLPSAASPARQPTWKTPAIRTRGCRRTTRRARPQASPSAGLRRSPTRSGPDQGLDGSEGGLQAIPFVGDCMGGGLAG